MIKNISIFLLFTILIILTASCGNLTSAASGSANHWWTLWLDRPACQSPCWQNITPGITSTNDAIHILEKIPGVVITYKDEYSASWSFSENKTDSGDMRGSENGIVSTIWLGNSSSKSLYLETIVASYGEPSYIKLYDCRALEDSGETMCATVLVYPDIGLLVDVFLEDTMVLNAHQVNIQPDIVVSGVYFFQPGLENFKSWSEFQEHELLEWKGYSIYSSDIQ